MDNKVFNTSKLYSVTFVVIIVLIMSVVVISTKMLDGRNSNSVVSFSDKWMMDGKEEYVIDDILVKDFMNVIILEKNLPDNIKFGDSICFEAKNTNFSVIIDGKERYSFKSEENLSGLGYGVAFFEINLLKEDSGKIIKFEYDSVDPELSAGWIGNVCIGQVSDYVHMQFMKRLFPFTVSTLIIFFGVILMIIYQWIIDQNRLPFDLGALGLTATILGLWLIVDSKMIQLLIGHIYVCRSIERLALFFVCYPFIRFLNSLTKLKRSIYEKIALLITVIYISILPALKYFAGIDMIESFVKVLICYLITILIVIFVVALDNTFYCHNRGIKSNLKLFFTAITIFWVSALADFILYHFELFSADIYGTFTRLVTLSLIAELLYRFLVWWTTNQASVERDSFISRTLQYAMTSDSSETRITSMLEFLGEEINVGRILIFEEQTNKKYRGTYEWYEEGKGYGAYNLLYLPYEGFVSILPKVFSENNNKLVIEDVEKKKTEMPQLYNLMTTNNITNMVVSPLEVNDRMIGLFSFVDIPKEKIAIVSDIIESTAYFLSQLILRRDEQARLHFYSYNDSLTGALNMRAYQDYIETGLDMAAAFGYLICEIGELKKINYIQGYEIGDKMVSDLVTCMIDVFGKDNVYRVGSTEFVAFGFETEEDFFYNDVDRVRKKAGEKNISVFAGAVYCSYGTLDMNKVINRANELLSREKENETRQMA